MADYSVNHLYDLINKQIDYQEDLNECLSKAEALARMALSNDFLDCSDEIKNNYLWTLNDLIDNAKIINERAICLLFERKNPITEPISNEH